MKAWKQFNDDFNTDWKQLNSNNTEWKCFNGDNPAWNSLMKKITVIIIMIVIKIETENSLTVIIIDAESWNQCSVFNTP